MIFIGLHKYYIYRYNNITMLNVIFGTYNTDICMHVINIKPLHHIVHHNGPPGNYVSTLKGYEITQ